MDLAQHDYSDREADFVIKHSATGEPTDAKIRLRSLENTAVRAGSRARLVKAINQAREVSDDDPEGPTPIERDAIETCVRATVGWQNIEVDGKPLEFNTANARMIYSKHEWLRNQVSEFVAVRRNFWRASSEG